MQIVLKFLNNINLTHISVCIYLLSTRKKFFHSGIELLGILEMEGVPAFREHFKPAINKKDNSQLGLAYCTKNAVVRILIYKVNKLVFSHYQVMDWDKQSVQAIMKSAHINIVFLPYLTLPSLIRSYSLHTTVLMCNVEY